MSKIRRSADAIRAAIARIQDEPLKTFEELSDTLRVEVPGLPTHVSVGTLDRWATEGRLAADEVTRVWLDAIKRRGTWVTSRAAVERFLAALAGKVEAKG